MVVWNQSERQYYLIKSEVDNPEEGIPLKQEENDENKIKTKKDKPDGGWGWLIVFGVAISNMTTQSLISVFGLLFLERLFELKITTQGASIIMSIQTTTLNVSGLIAGPLIKRFSYRKVALAGAVLVVTGLLLTTLASSLLGFVFTYSIFTGSGLGFLYPSTFVAINSYFSSRKGRAVGLSVAGTGVGQMLLPFIVDYLLRQYGFNGTLLVLAGIASHSIMGATLYQPVKWHLKEKYDIVEKEALEKEKDDEEEKVMDKYDESEWSNLAKKRRGFFYSLGSALNIELMGNASFVNLILGLGMVYVANMCFSMLFPFFLESKNYSRPEIVLSMSFLSGADIIGRLIVPICTDVLKMKSKSIFFLGAMLSAIARSALVNQNNIVIIIFMACICGMVRAALICNFNLSISEQTPPDKLPSALGLHMLIKGAAVLMFAPLIGVLRDNTKSYSLSIHILNIFFLVVPFFCWLFEYVYTRLYKSSVIY